MLNTLILYSLLDRNLTTYGIRKDITDNFFLYVRPSLGAVHPAVLKLCENKFIEVSKNITEGGQKSMLHHILNDGKKYFFENWSNINSTIIKKISAEIQMKIIMLPKIKDANLKNLFFENSLQALEMSEYEIQNVMKNESCGYIQTSSSLLYKEIKSVRETILSLQKEDSR